MAVAAMLKVRVYGLKKNRKSTLEALQRRGVIDVCDEDLNLNGVERIDTLGQENTFLKAIATFEKALEILEEASPENKTAFESLKGKKELSLRDYYKFVSEAETITKEAKRIADIKKEISDQKAEKAKCQGTKQTFAPWQSLDVPFGFKGTQSTAAVFGTYPEKKSREEICTLFSEAILKQGEEPDDFSVETEIISQDENLKQPFQNCLVI